ncbi:hypothetical protein PM082_004059 [Marasmius tenuissimus]|nr:hypothetical protein PM082_004059 [Marasmius tenuissimus]
MSTLRTHRVRTAVFVKKRQGIAIEFDCYWLSNHPKVLLDFARGKKGIIKYEQLHVYQAEKGRLKKMRAPVFDYDGVVLFDSGSLDAMDTWVQHRQLHATGHPRPTQIHRPKVMCCLSAQHRFHTRHRRRLKHRRSDGFCLINVLAASHKTPKESLKGHLGLESEARDRR